MPVAAGSPEKVAFGRDVYRYIWTAMGALTLLWASLSILHPLLIHIWLTFYLPTVIAMFVGLWLNSRGETKHAVIVLLASGWTVFTLLAVLYQPVLPPDNNRYIIIVVAAGLLLGKRAGILSATICGLTEIALTLLVKTGTKAATAPDVSASMLLPHLFFLYLAALVPMFATRRVRVALQIADEEREERRRAEEIASENEMRFLALVDHSPDAIMIHRDGKFIHLNPASLEILRANSLNQLLGKSIMEVVHPDHRELVATALDQMQKTRTSSQIREGRMLRLDGAVADVETASIPVSFQGAPAIQTIVRDVTDRKKLQEQMRLQIAALNSAANDIVITDREGTIVWVNAAFESLTGYNLSETIGRNPRELVKSGKQGPSFYKELWESILSGKPWHGELVNRRKDSTLYNEYMTITPVLDEHGAITHFVAVKQDITSQKLLEEQLLQSHKLEGIGQLAGGVAHDYNNILNVVVGYAELLRRKMSENDPAKQPLDAIVNAARRGADLTRQLLAFARKEIISPKVINVNSAVESIRNMLNRVIGENVKLVFIPTKDLWNVRIDPTQFDQILVNLASNARDAIKDVGTITIKTVNVSLPPGYLRGSSDMAQGEYVKIKFEDDGRGMDAETLKRIFEPFFTTKPKGHGTGLGLSTIYGIVKQNGGAIEVASEFGKGSTFVVYLPRFVGETYEPEKELPDESLRGTETILVVEDQADLLNLAKTSLEEFGYNVMTSLDSVDAELLSDAYGGEIHLLLADVIMPKMGGVELSRRISSRRSGMKTLYMSGYTSSDFSGDGHPGEAFEFIQKPFRIQELARKVREILSR